MTGERLGFPAHAGMDLYRNRYQPMVMRFPRPRGDGPLGPVEAEAGTLVSPPTRGWTSLSRPRRRTHEGFPAHAGMDPVTHATRWTAVWFPRPRGDGPWSDHARPRQTWVSPPTRGWTLVSELLLLGSHGFPAHAGMDHTEGSWRRGRRWFPRPRGDGPQIARLQAKISRVSPPTRGWTLRTIYQTGNVYGFPAHAGMDPNTNGRCRA